MVSLGLQVPQHFPRTKEKVGFRPDEHRLDSRSSVSVTPVPQPLDAEVLKPSSVSGGPGRDGRSHSHGWCPGLTVPGTWDGRPGGTGRTGPKGSGLGGLSREGLTTSVSRLHERRERFLLRRILRTVPPFRPQPPP